MLFLDEPTAGVDPEGRIVVRDIIAAQRDRGICVILTTHELAEAERLADRVVIIDHGRMLAEGTPAELAAGTADGSIRFTTDPGIDTAALAAAVGAGSHRRRGASGRLPAPPGGAAPLPTVVAALAGWLAERDLSLGDLRTGQSLEEAYLAITGSRERPTRRHRPDGRAPRPAGSARPARHGPMRPLTAQLRAEVTMLVHQRRDPVPHPGHPGGVPAVLLGRARAAHRHQAPGGLPGPGHPGPGHHVHGDDRPRHRHRLRARLRRAQAAGLHPPRSAPPAGGQDRRPSSSWSCSRPRCWWPWATPWAGAPVARRGGALVGAAVGAMVLGTVAFGGIGLVLAGTLKPLVNLAVVNGLFVVLLLLGGMLIPLGKLPGWLADVAKVLPAVGPGRCPARAPWATGPRCRPATGRCWPSGRWPPRWWPALTFRWE